MKNFLINILFILTISSISFSQIKPDIKPLSFNIEYTNTKNDIKYQNQTIHALFLDDNHIAQINVNLEEISKYKLQIKINDFTNEDRLFIIDRLNKNKPQVNQSQDGEDTEYVLKDDNEDVSYPNLKNEELDINLPESSKEK